MAEHNTDYGTTGKPHPYHLVNPSIWPLAASFAAGLLALGAVLFMHDTSWGDFEIGLKGVLLGVACVLACMFFWWRDIIFESIRENVHNPVTEIGLRFGMALFIASEVMFFVAFFWAFFDAALFPGEAQQFLRTEFTGGQWPPVGIHVIDALGLPFMMTMILLLSGCTVTWAHHEILHGSIAEGAKAIGLTVLLGIFFLGFQVYEYMHAPYGFTGGIYPSTFYMATGFHGFHVFVGTVFLFVCWLRARAGHFTRTRHFGFEAAAWYWHFVDVVWLFLFVAVYFWGNIGGTVAAH